MVAAKQTLLFLFPWFSLFQYFAASIRVRVCCLQAPQRWGITRLILFLSSSSSCAPEPSIQPLSSISPRDQNPTLIIVSSPLSFLARSLRGNSQFVRWKPFPLDLDHGQTSLISPFWSASSLNGLAFFKEIEVLPPYRCMVKWTGASTYPTVQQGQWWLGPSSIIFLSGD